MPIIVRLSPSASALDPHLAERGIDEERHRPPVPGLRAGLAVNGDILLEEPPAELGHDRLGLSLRVGFARIDTLLRLGQDFQRGGPRLDRGDADVLSDGEPAQLAADAGLEDIVLPARFPDTDAEAGELAVPVDGIGAACLEGLDGALGEFGAAICYDSSFLTSELPLTSGTTTRRPSSRLAPRDSLQRRYRVQPPMTRGSPA